MMAPMGCLVSLGMPVWFLVWLAHGAPYLLASWNPWNVSLVLLAFFLVMVRVRRRPRRSK